jgi:hypothetical protein
MDSRERTLGTRPSIFRKTDAVIPELDQPAAGQEHESSKGPKRHRIKATFYLNPEDVLAIDGMQSDEFRKTGKKPERSEIVSRAVQALKELKEQQD